MAVAIVSFLVQLTAILLSSTKIVAQQTDTDTDARVGGGERISQGRPYLVLLWFSHSGPRRPPGVHYCGGTLVTRQWVMTAAHCLEPGLGKTAVVADIGFGRSSIVWYLEKQRTSRIERIGVDKIVVHPRYHVHSRTGIIYNDIALLRLIKPVRDAWRVVPYGTNVNSPGNARTAAYVAGWGSEDDDEQGTVPSIVLREAEVTIRPQEKCRSLFSRIGDFNTSSMLCALGDEVPEPADACEGDSGGPLVLYNRQTGSLLAVGIVSWGIGCRNPFYPGVYTKVAHFAKWIKTTTSQTGTTHCGSTSDCPTGYASIQGKCYDVDECSVDNGECQQACGNFPGSYRCSCRAGYQLQLDSKSCALLVEEPSTQEPPTQSVRSSGIAKGEAPTKAPPSTDFKLIIQLVSRSSTAVQVDCTATATGNDKIKQLTWKFGGGGRKVTKGFNVDKAVKQYEVGSNNPKAVANLQKTTRLRIERISGDTIGTYLCLVQGMTGKTYRKTYTIDE